MPSRVLIVDDEPSILATMAPLLRSRGYEVSTAMSAKACLESVERVDPDLIILDLGLPDMDGVDVCRLLRDGRSIPILVLSARGAEADKVGALDAGADDYVTKPFGSEELLARIRVALRRVEASPARTFAAFTGENDPSALCCDCSLASTDSMLLNCVSSRVRFCSSRSLS